MMLQLTWVVVFMAVVLLDVDMGLAVGLGFCLLTVVFRTQRLVTALIFIVLPDICNFFETWFVCVCVCVC